jgi:hypothetical protein
MENYKKPYYPKEPKQAEEYNKRNIIELDVLNPQCQCVKWEIRYEIKGKKRFQVTGGCFLSINNLYSLVPVGCNKIENDINNKEDVYNEK